MPTEFAERIRAHAHALIKLARVQGDTVLATELERLALELLQDVYDFEKLLRK